MSNKLQDSTCIHEVKFANVKGFLIIQDQSAIMIDTGHRNTTGQFRTALDDLGIAPEAIGLIILTHTHFDHAGGASALKKLTGAPLAVHRNEADNLRRGHTPFPKGTRWKGKLLVFLGNIFSRKIAWYPEVEPDIIIDHSLDLMPYGISGVAVFTPGHTSGSVSVILENGSAVVGDNVLGVSLKTHYPPFANDREGVLKAWELYINSGAKLVYPAHGKPVTIDSLVNELEDAREKYN